MSASAAPHPDDLLESMAVGYVRLARDWTMTRVNLAGERILGRRSAELVGRSMWDEFPGARELEFGRVYGAVMETRVAQTMEAYYPELASWFELRVEPEGDGIALYFLDVTARRQATERLALLARYAAVVADVAAALTATLDVTENVGSLARLVLPDLGSWSVVSLVDDDGGLVHAGSWHLDPARRDQVTRFAELRVPTIARSDSLGGRAVSLGAVVGSTDMAGRIATMPAGATRDLLAALAPRSVLQVPMVARGRTVGLLSVFADEPHTAEQQTLARDVAARAAFAIDNSVSYARAEAARTEAEAAGRRLALLAKTTETLSAGDDIEVAVGRLAQLVVPALADWSIVTVVDEADGRVHDPGWAHRDAALAPQVAEYARRRALAMNPGSPLSTALRTGESAVYRSIDTGFVASAVPDPEVAALANALRPHGVIVVPLASHGRVFGAITLVTTPERGNHTADEVQAAVEVAARAGAALDSARSALRAKTLAESVQRSMLTVAAPGPRLEIATRYRPADVDRQVGGDWYDYFQRGAGAEPGEGPTVVTIGDVMGHDVAAIASMAQLRTTMRSTAWSHRNSPADVLRFTDDISAHLGPGTFATVVTAHLRPQPDGSASLRWANAGHLPPAVLGCDGVVTMLRPEVTEPPLGVRPESARTTHETVVAPGSTIVLYTDGLIERRGEDLETRQLELGRTLRELARLPLEDLLDRLIGELAAVGQRDDIALLAVRVVPPA